ncbi:uncharacterized protein GIQ15_06778 [Arthroderma uncinatum]|uniref:uncharacterized protein n=1 Tax=Arthroderma uncinatum TaxID=74035 RepID=UPI00144A9C7E|nr:uncharacterized protein GIQ15_06778 [Arthroderma uncinatum]KAF3479802.1 hypothetical protein GIQ15_06778 [Arthroderma uncinatum]
MSSPVPTTPKAPRSARRNQKRTPSSKNAAAETTSQQPGPATARDVRAVSDSANNGPESAAKSKKGRSVKKNKDNVKNSPAPAQQASHGHRHTSSQPSIKSPTFRDSPHYAGPTFHASPAPSALPIPSFFSKSVPETDYPTSDDLQDDSPDSDPGNTTPTKANNTLLAQQEAGTASPLDFLFKAARQARTTNPLSELEDSRASTPPSRNVMRSQQHEGQANSGLFPLELEGSDARSSPIGPSFATSYRDRMNALRATSPGKQPASTQESEAKIKSEALKNLLLNPTAQRAASASPRLTDQSNPAGNSFRMSGEYGIRYASGPTSPVPFTHSGRPLGTRNEHGPESNSSVPQQYLASLCAQPHRAPSSSLRTVVSPTSPVTPPRQRSARYTQLSSAPPAHQSYHGSPGGFVSPTPNRTMPPLSATPPARNGAPPRLDATETKRMEDDLRRILKLNVGDGRSPNNMEQTIA